MGSATPHRILPSPEAIGEYIAERVLRRIEEARRGGSAAPDLVLRSRPN
jgi:hypothetical protein